MEESLHIQKALRDRYTGHGYHLNSETKGIINLGRTSNTKIMKDNQQKMVSGKKNYPLKWRISNSSSKTSELRHVAFIWGLTNSDHKNVTKKKNVLNKMFKTMYF